MTIVGDLAASQPRSTNRNPGQSPIREAIYFISDFPHVWTDFAFPRRTHNTCILCVLAVERLDGGLRHAGEFLHQPSPLG